MSSFLCYVIFCVDFVACVLYVVECGLSDLFLYPFAGEHGRSKYFYSLI